MTRPVRVWAPAAKRVDVIARGSEISAVPDGNGWWRGPELEAGATYAFRIDGGEPRPDPRSVWQPHGVHGPSCVVDAHEAPRALARHIPLRDAIIYELHIGTFSAGGTFQSAVPHLDHLVELGVTHVELMPIAQFPGTHGWGYDGVGLFAAHAPYGGPQGLRTLIDECHARGLAVLIDVVHNHFGPEGAYASELAPYKTQKHHTPWGEAINL